MLMIQFIKEKVKRNYVLKRMENFFFSEFKRKEKNRKEGKKEDKYRFLV